MDIVDDALLRFKLNWEVEPTRTARFRVAGIANGFPYYVHLLIEKLLYAIYCDKGASDVTLMHLREAISSAVQDAQEEIRKHYDHATRGRNATYKYVTWAAADAWSLERSTTDIYASYRVICEMMGAQPLEQKSFLQILAALKRKNYGPILRAGYRKGLYQYSENIVRGYVRLCASAEGVELNDLGPEDEVKKIVGTPREKRYIDPRRLGGSPGNFGIRG